ncbi:ribosomal protection-like ABC-F family protein [Inediibacterium massiliense]|uniref:ribosomal protection-like ABC-F family protein n=1 Tax=Inediibacterium massiliense TaxID=1658111 RepID=UPI0006B4D834|nr:ABC-F type ribosomal protection protein [Inediibacterium massiliense]
MLLIECNKIKKYFGDRLILNVDHLKIDSEDRIGIVGKNGVGKTTLMNILSQRLEPDEGSLKLYGKFEYISQLEPPNRKNISDEMASKFDVESTWDENMSGGEKARFKFAQALDSHSMMVFADEPTSNVDMEGVELIEEKFGAYRGALIVISHDRSFLDKLCNQILEIENGKIKSYKGNYSDYREQKIKERERDQFEYEEYVKEKKRLGEVMDQIKQKSKNIKRVPNRMGNSEARLHKMGGQKAKANLNRAVKNAQKRIEHMKVKEKPREQEKIKLDIMDSNGLHSKIIIEGKNINKAFANKIIFKNAEFTIYNGSRVALIGPNGSGKTTLMKMIMNNEDAITIAQGAKIGYFSQDMNLLNKNASIIENVMESSAYPENFARLLLARLLFKGEMIYKKVDILSGGERVKVSFAKILLQDINLLILDEPTNYMDIDAIEVIEETLKEYDRTLLFVSHDRSFVDHVANQIMTIKDQKIEIFIGNYTEYLARNNKSTDYHKEKIQNQEMILRNRLSEVIGRLSMPSKKDDTEVLDKEYYKILGALKRLKG